MPHIDAKSKSDVPFYPALDRYEWVDDYLKSLEIQDEIRRLRDRKKALRRTSSTKTDYKRRLKESFDAFQARRQQFLRNFLKKNERSNDPFGRFERGGPLQQYFGPSISWEEVAAAADQLDVSGGITDSRRDKELESIEKNLAQLKEQLRKVTAPSYFGLKDAAVTGDSRQRFVAHWHGQQAKCCEPCGPRGITLELSVPNEREAYDKLKIFNSINSKTKNQPHPGPHKGIG